MSGFLIFVLALGGMSIIFSIIALATVPSLNHREQLKEICELLREIQDTLKDIHSNLGVKMESTIKSAINSDEIMERLRNSLKTILDEQYLCHPVQFEDVEFAPRIEDLEDSNSEPDKPMAQCNSFDEIEESVSQQHKVKQYGDRFFVDNFGPDKKNNGMAIRIRKSFHQQLGRISFRSCADGANMTTYLDNIIADHLERYKDEVDAVCHGDYIPDKYKHMYL